MPRGTCGDPRGVGVSYERGTPVRPEVETRVAVWERNVNASVPNRAVKATLAATQGQILSQSPTDATRF